MSVSHILIASLGAVCFLYAIALMVKDLRKFCWDENSKTIAISGAVSAVALAVFAGLGYYISVHG